MPLAVTHVLIPLILVDLYRDYFSKVKFNLHYVFIAGLAGLLPDIDIAVFWVISVFKKIPLNEIHRTFTHSLFFLLIFIVLFFLTRDFNFKWLGKKKLSLDKVFLAISFGVFIHLVLDALLSGHIMPLYPFSSFELGLNLIKEGSFGGTFFTGLDAILLVVWLIHEEINHKISDYI
ncbi:MAG: metal-dependent hydrolase [Nanoarchaeota archaeon]|nr:metal-dependent hydrolase [Nanoarchaeota archaeon]